MKVSNLIAVLQNCPDMNVMVDDSSYDMSPVRRVYLTPDGDVLVTSWDYDDFEVIA